MTDADQCPTCGRVSEDWATRRAGPKDTQRKDAALDRTADYRSWRQGWGDGLYVSDLDQVEWRIVDGEVVPVLVLELTRLDGNVSPPPSYFQAIVSRFTERDGQGSAVIALSAQLKVDAVIVLFRHDLSEFWLYNLTTGGEWHKATPNQYRKWLARHDGLAAAK